MRMATTFSRILEFSEKLEDWIQYSLQVGHFFTAKDIVDASKKAKQCIGIFIVTFIGTQTL